LCVSSYTRDDRQGQHVFGKHCHRTSRQLLVELVERLVWPLKGVILQAAARPLRAFLSILLGIIFPCLGVYRRCSLWHSFLVVLSSVLAEDIVRSCRHWPSWHVDIKGLDQKVVWGLPPHGGPIFRSNHSSSLRMSLMRTRKCRPMSLTSLNPMSLRSPRLEVRCRLDR
jgi:hypothetical protein